MNCLSKKCGICTAFLFLFLFLPLLSQGQSVRAWQPLTLINYVFSQRLEANFKYQEAVLPADNTRCRSYLKMAHSRYPLVQTLLQRDGRIEQDNYQLRKGSELLQSSFESRYTIGQSPSLSSQNQQVSYYNAYTFNDHGIQQETALIMQNFNPTDILKNEAADLDLATHELFFYVIDNRLAWKGDTLAHYQIEHSDSTNFFRLTLNERLNFPNHRWHTNHSTTQIWHVIQQGTAHWSVISERSGKRWTRAYHNAHDFTETLEVSYASSMLGGGSGVHGIVYQREYRRRSKRKAIDIYTFNSRAATATVKFTVIHLND